MPVMGFVCSTNTVEQMNILLSIQKSIVGILIKIVLNLTIEFWNDLHYMNWRRNWLPTPVFLPGESHGQRSQAGYIQSMGLHRVGYTCVIQFLFKGYIQPRSAGRLDWSLVTSNNFMRKLYLYITGQKRTKDKC